MYFPYFTILCLLHPAHRARRNTFFSDRQQSSDGHASRTPPGRRSGPLSRPGGGAPLQSLPWPRAPYKRISNSYFEIPSIVLVFTPSVSGTKSGAAAPPFLVFTPSVSGTKSGAAARVGGPTRAGNRASAGAGASACARRLPRRGPSSQFLRFPGTRHPGASARSPDVYDDSTLRLGPRGSQKAHPPPLRPPRRSLTAHLRSRADPPAPLRTLSRVLLTQGAPGASPAARAQHKRADRPRSGPGRLLQRARIGR